MNLFPARRPACSLRWMLVALFLLAAAPGLSARAQNTEGIVVQGIGTAKGRPTQVDIAATISADAELAADATVKYRDAKKRAVNTMDGLRNPSLSLEFAGFGINSTLDATTQQLVQRGQIVTPPKSKIQVSESCRITLKDIDKMPAETLMETLFKIVDAAKDGGFQIGAISPVNTYDQQGRLISNNPLVVFEIPDYTAVRDQAYKAALDDAKTKAQKLADLAGVKLGRVLSVQEVPRGQVTTNAGTSSVFARAGTDDKSFIANAFGDMAVHAILTVQFEIVK